jgi:hypothetical protein
MLLTIGGTNLDAYCPYTVRNQKIFETNRPFQLSGVLLQPTISCTYERYYRAS